ncbi:RraA family protein [Phenylobacterium sp.]|uniref:RraA family protein n=1 Tax=Phenylobacterium sp. TaxID=1871053 RepID=UPI0035696658
MVKAIEPLQHLLSVARAELFTAVIGDVLDQMGLTRQFLRPCLRPITPVMRIVGWAMPVEERDLPEDPEQRVGKPFGRMFEALDDLQPDEVYICAGSSPTYALWGGLMSTRAKACGAAGAVLHGYHRDTSDILALDFPVASFGAYAQDQGVRGEVSGWRRPIEVDGVSVVPGDLIFGDRDGVLVVPQDAVAETVTRALEKVRSENLVAKALSAGMTSQQAFDTYGVM